MRAVCGFLGLAGYYRKFVHGYGALAAPLSALLKEEGFSWDDAAASAFAALKAAITTAPVLAMPDFTKLFTVECDASTVRFGAVLTQEGHPVAFFSRPVAPRHRALAAYERELIGLVQAVRHWRPYLWGRSFIVKTDHYSLKYLLDQRLATIPQHHWVGKLLGFDFSVEYRSDATNIVADALSRCDTDEGEAMAISAPRFDLIDRLRHAQATNLAAVALYAEVHTGARAAPWALVDGMVTYDGSLYIPPTSRFSRRSWQPSTTMATRSSTAPSIDFGVISTSPTCAALCRHSCRPAVPASSTCQTTSGRRVCCSCYRCRPLSGHTSASISSRRCPRCRARQSSSPW